MQHIDYWISIDHRSPGDKERDSLALCVDGLETAGLMTAELRVQYDKDWVELEDALTERDNGGYFDPWEIVQEWEQRVEDLSNGDLITFFDEGDFHVCDYDTYQEKYAELNDY